MINYIEDVEFLERVFIALGSNLSPRGVHLEEAKEMLKKISSGGWKESPVYETPPIGPPNQNAYFNQVVSFWYSGSPSRLLFYLKGSELILGRQPRGHWCSREIDMDLLYFGSKITTERPTIPHREILKRQFVLVPMNDIAPEWEDPLSGLTISNLLNELQTREGVIPFRVVTGERD